MKQKCFQLSLRLSIASVLSQRRWQRVPHTWSSDGETSGAGVRPRYRAYPVICSSKWPTTTVGDKVDVVNQGTWVHGPTMTPATMLAGWSLHSPCLLQMWVFLGHTSTIHMLANTIVKREQLRSNTLLRSTHADKVAL